MAQGLEHARMKATKHRPVGAWVKRKYLGHPIEELHQQSRPRPHVKRHPLHVTGVGVIGLLGLAFAAYVVWQMTFWSGASSAWTVPTLWLFGFPAVWFLGHLFKQMPTSGVSLAQAIYIWVVGEFLVAFLTGAMVNTLSTPTLVIAAVIAGVFALALFPALARWAKRVRLHAAGRHA